MLRRMGDWILDQLARAWWDAEEIVEEGASAIYWEWSAPKGPGRADRRDQRRKVWLFLRLLLRAR